MNQALGFGLLGIGGIFLVKSVTGSSFSQVVQGHPASISQTGANVLGSGVAGVGQSLAGGSSSSSSSSSTSSTPTGAQGSVTPSLLQSIGSKFGWTGQEIADWQGVIARESGGRLTAQNPTSNAYGIAQFINGPSEYYTYGGNPNTVPGQLTAMANYIKERYGSPSAALAHENTAGWY